MAVIDTAQLPIGSSPFSGGTASIQALALPSMSRGLQFLEAPTGPFGFQGAMKRLLDVVVSVALLILWAPIFLAIAVLIKLDSPGPAIIRQNRVGRNGTPFEILKFRSMVSNAEQLRQDLSGLNEAQAPMFKIRQDPRITRVGRHLRRLSVDELPQLLNVVRGDMSLVGPRPPFAHEVHEDYVRQSLRLKFPPGMTGLWQVCGRSGVDYDGMIRLDLQYTREWSISLDLKILIRTLPVVISAKGAC